MGYRLYIGVNFSQFETGDTKPTSYLALDYQGDKTIQSNSQLCMQPLQSGDTMLDHMYNDPDTLSVSGTFALNGKNWNDDSYNIFNQGDDDSNSGDRLTKIEQVFEKIKKEGYLCTLVTYDDERSNGDIIEINSENSNEGSTNVRFKVRHNMALFGITWTEKQNSVGYQFQFKEVIMVEKQEVTDLPKDLEFDLPNVTQAASSSIGSLLYSTGLVKRFVLMALANSGYIQADFYAEVIKKYGNTSTGQTFKQLVEEGSISDNLILAAAGALGIVVGVGVTMKVITGGVLVKGILAGTGTALGVGGIVGAAVGVIAVGIAALILHINKVNADKARAEKLNKAFKLVNNNCDNDFNRLEILLQNISAKLNQACSNIFIYTINGDNKPTQVLLNLAGNAYCLDFTRPNAVENASTTWQCNVTNMSNENMTDLKGNPLTAASTLPVKSDILGLNRNMDIWFRDSTWTYDVYLVNPYLNEAYEMSEEDRNKCKNDLSKHLIIVSKGDIQDEYNNLKNIINQALVDEGLV